MQLEDVRRVKLSWIAAILIVRSLIFPGKISSFFPLVQSGINYELLFFLFQFLGSQVPVLDRRWELSLLSRSEADRKRVCKSESAQLPVVTKNG